MLPQEYIMPEYDVVRDQSKCIQCRVCERQCANEVHRYDADTGLMMSDSAQCVDCQRCVCMNCGRKNPVGNYCSAGMHGGKMYIRCDELPGDLPSQVVSHRADVGDMEHIRPILEEFCACFGYKMADVLKKPFYVLIPNTNNPYRSLYTPN